MESFFELRDYISGDTCGLIKVIDADPNEQMVAEEEIQESWAEFNKNEEDEFIDCGSVDDFVKWHNEGRVTQIERVFVTIIQPE
jgi:hypothetical protein